MTLYAMATGHHDGSGHTPLFCMVMNDDAIRFNYMFFSVFSVPQWRREGLIHNYDSLGSGRCALR